MTRVRQRAGIAAVALAVVLVVAGTVWTDAVRVRDAVGDEDRGTGAVMVLGGAALRLEHALGLEGVAGPDGARTGGARELVVSAGAVADLVARGGDCEDPGVTCVAPEPVSTYGEALAAATLARERGWGELTVVTSDFHVGRTRWLFERCVDAAVTVVAADDPAAAPLDGWRLAREAGALARSRVLGHCR